MTAESRVSDNRVVKALLVARESPVRSRLIELISEVQGIRLEVRDPYDAADLIPRQLLPDVILIDIDQTRGHGLEIIRRFREGRSGHSPVIVALARSGSIHYRSSCLDAGAMYYFNLEREQEWLLDSLVSIRKQMA